MTDPQVIAQVLAGDTAQFEVLMRRHNQRVYRVARAIVKDEAEAEDVMQQSYINAFLHLDQFGERSQFSTWLTRITVHEALSRRRKWQPEVVASREDEGAHGDHMDGFSSDRPDPEREAYGRELGRFLEAAVDALPETYRTVFMLREIEGLSTAETAQGLELGEEAVKTRLHRARGMVRRAVAGHIGAAGVANAFPFHASRCDRVAAVVMAAIRQHSLAPPT